MNPIFHISTTTPLIRKHFRLPITRQAIARYGAPETLNTEDSIYFSQQSLILAALTAFLGLNGTRKQGTVCLVIASSQARGFY